MAYAVVLVVALIVLVAVLWDLWMPPSVAGKRRPGAVGVLMAVVFLATALLVALTSLPGHLALLALGLGLLSCANPARILLAYARDERARAKQAAAKRLQQETELPESLVHADNELKARYDDLMRRFSTSDDPRADPELLEQGRQLAAALNNAAILLGASRRYELSPEIPVLRYWAAQLSRNSYPPGHEQHLAHEQALRYYDNFESTAWLWKRYSEGGKD